MMTDQFGLKKAVIDEINAIFEKNTHVKKVILYGSRAMGNYKVGSDIDLTLIGNSDLCYDDISNIQSELDDTYIPYLFDISILSDISNPGLVEHINRVGKIFYERGSKNDN